MIPSHHLYIDHGCQVCHFCAVFASSAFFNFMILLNKSVHVLYAVFSDIDCFNKPGLLCN